MPKVIPFGDRILVKRRPIGEKVSKDSKIILPEETADRPTDLADVISVPDLTFGDNQILAKADDIIASLVKKASEGDDEALIASLRLNEFVKMKSIKPGDGVMIGKYVGTDFHETGEKENLTLVREGDIIGLVVDDNTKE